MLADVSLGAVAAGPLGARITTHDAPLQIEPENGVVDDRLQAGRRVRLCSVMYFPAKPPRRDLPCIRRQTPPPRFVPCPRRQRNGNQRSFYAPPARRSGGLCVQPSRSTPEQTASGRDRPLPGRRAGRQVCGGGFRQAVAAGCRSRFSALRVSQLWPAVQVVILLVDDLPPFASAARRRGFDRRWRQSSASSIIAPVEIDRLQQHA